MKKDKLLELIKYIKEKNLIEKYNDIYKEYDEKNEDKNPGFKLEDLYSLSDEEITLIVSSKHDVEALFRLRMNSIGYKELMKREVKTNDSVVLETIEDFRTMSDYEKYDKDKNIIDFIIKQDKQAIDNIILFLTHMVNKHELSNCNLSVDYLVYYLRTIAECKTYKSANLIALLASSSDERREHGLYNAVKYSTYGTKIIDKISECDKNFQADYIAALLKMKGNNPVCNKILLQNFYKEDNSVKVVELFTKTENEEACKRMLEILRENEGNLSKKSDYVINMLIECSTLKSDEDFVLITTITSIDELENILGLNKQATEIDENIRLKVKKKKKI